ncbi:haloacid dehalogenase type II [Micromonospora sp. STR1s_5]|nr:haloacid dehalogenase type II [Micromonospora sp. STR1s_5]
MVAFDIIETTFRIEPLDRQLVRLGLPPGSYRRLYAEGLRDAFALACSNRFQPFMSVLKANLAGLIAEYDLEQGDAALTDALSIMKELPPHADAPEAYAGLKAAGIRIFALSNGAAASTRSLLEKAGMADLVEQVLSVEDVRLSKPRPEVYLYTVETAKVRPEEVMLVACHPWDVAGALSAGLRAAYVSRERPYPDQIMAQPEIAEGSLMDVSRAILKGQS